MPKAWNVTKLYEWLRKHPIPEHLQKHELSFVDNQVEKLQQFVITENLKDNMHSTEKLQQWSYKNPISWLQLYHALIEDNVKGALAKGMQVNSVLI